MPQVRNGDERLQVRRQEEAAAVSDSVTFLCAFPPIQGAIRITGAGDGMRIQLDIPESELPQAIRLLTMREQVLRVTVEVAEKQTW